MRTVLVLVGMLGVALGSEWLTSGGNHCTEKCKIGKRKDVEEVFWCPVVDGLSLEHKPVASSRPSVQESKIEEEDKIKWDYCTPAPVAGITEEDSAQEFVPAETLPANITRKKRQAGSGGNFNPGRDVIVASSKPGVDCVGPCTQQSDAKTQCNVSEDGKQQFYCSKRTSLDRIQISSQNKLWCTGPCIKSAGDEYYQCKTLFGKDRCSPSQDRSASGDSCTSACKKDGNHYKCHTDEIMTKLADCGFWNHPKADMKSLEYTVENQVCASPCAELDGNLMCSFVEWEWKSDLKTANLELRMGSCDHNAKNGTNWTIVGVIIGCLVVAIVVIVVVAGVVKKKKYSPAATGDI